MDSNTSIEALKKIFNNNNESFENSKIIKSELDLKKKQIQNQNIKWSKEAPYTKLMLPIDEDKQSIYDRQGEVTEQWGISVRIITKQNNKLSPHIISEYFKENLKPKQISSLWEKVISKSTKKYAHIPDEIKTKLDDLFFNENNRKEIVNIEIKNELKELWECKKIEWQNNTKTKQQIIDEIREKLELQEYSYKTIIQWINQDIQDENYITRKEIITNEDYNDLLQNKIDIHQIESQYVPIGRFEPLFSLIDKYYNQIAEKERINKYGDIHQRPIKPSEQLKKDYNIVKDYQNFLYRHFYDEQNFYVDEIKKINETILRELEHIKNSKSGNGVYSYIDSGKYYTANFVQKKQIKEKIQYLNQRYALNLHSIAIQNLINSL